MKPRQFTDGASSTIRALNGLPVTSVERLKANGGDRDVRMAHPSEELAISHSKGQAAIFSCPR